MSNMEKIRDVLCWVFEESPLNLHWFATAVDVPLDELLLIRDGQARCDASLWDDILNAIGMAGAELNVKAGELYGMKGPMGVVRTN